MVSRSESNVTGRTSSSVARSTKKKQEKHPQLVRVEKINKDVTEDHLNEIFSNFGTVLRVFYTKNNRKYTIRRFGFVEFSSVEEAEDAVLYMNGGQINGKIIDVRLASKKDTLGDYEKEPSRSPVKETSKKEKNTRDNHRSRSRDQDKKNVKHKSKTRSETPEIKERSEEKKVKPSPKKVSNNRKSSRNKKSNSKKRKERRPLRESSSSSMKQSTSTMKRTRARAVRNRNRSDSSNTSSLSSHSSSLTSDSPL